MAVPSLDDLLAELDRQDELDAVEPTVEAAATETIPEVQPEAKQEQQEGGSSGSIAVRRRRGGRFSDMMGSSGGAKPETGESQRMSTKAVDDCDASTRDDDERSPTWRTLGQVAQEHHRSEFGHSSSSEEAEGSRVTDLLLQEAEVDPERQRAQVEAAAFEERQRKAREEAEERAKEAWVAQEEAEERRVRANRYASVLEDKTRKLVEKQSSKRKKLREDEREQRQKEKDKRKEEKMRSEAARMSEKIRKMAEN
eukprot:symbB.v1.2.017274.t1/scaffold1347.1/size123984/11